jgi:hypothetical protein
VEELVARIFRVKVSQIGKWTDYIGYLEGLGHGARIGKSKPGMGKKRQNSG